MHTIRTSGPRRVELTAPVNCPACNRQLELKFRNASPGSKLHCPCGAEITLSGDDLRGAQAAMDNLLDTLHRIGR